MVVAVILGNRMNDYGTLSQKMQSRLGLALKLYAEKAPDRIIVSGGVANKVAGKAEADEMYKWLVSNGIPSDVLIKEGRSLTTKQNAKFSAPIIKGLGADKVILCTSAEHFNRRYLNPYKLFSRALKGSGVEIEKYTND